MGSATDGFASLNLLLVVMVFGLVLLILWSGPWRKPAVVRARAKASRPLKPKTRANCPICQAEQSLL